MIARFWERCSVSSGFTDNDGRNFSSIGSLPPRILANDHNCRAVWRYDREIGFIDKGEENMRNKALDCLALTIAIIGALNWGLIGLFSFDLVAFVFGNMSWFSRIIYALVGIAGLYIITFYMYTGNAAESSDRV